MRRMERHSRSVTRELGPTSMMVLRKERRGSGLVLTRVKATVQTTESVKTKMETAAQQMNLKTTSCSGR